ncbi:MAG: nitrophenyl compound nitroreductase subunit ArsF family protein [Candidatus Altiarchaeota archaeon]|nr:nitrophenyl compound nitroreductase subunit ArsF family protein [Candidatus Altiarchaeota archaeon]
MSKKRPTKQKIDLKTSNKTLIVVAGIVLLSLIVAGTVILGGMTDTTTTTTTTQPVETLPTCGLGETCEVAANDVKVEVYHFHRTSQCWSCKTLGALAEKTVNTYFKNELESGRLKFDHINVELAQNAELVNKYGATGSSLMIGTYKDGKFTKEEDTQVWYKLNNEEDYLSYLKGILEKRLEGELS